MPTCGCFHEYTLTLVGPNDYRLRLEIEGRVDLEDILDRTTLSQAVSVQRGLMGSTFTITGVTDGARLRSFIDLLRSTILVDLTPELRETYALGPYSWFDEEGNRGTAPMGELLNRAKYRRSSAEASQLGELLGAFLQGHPTLCNVDFVTAPPKSDPSTPDLPTSWARSTARMLDIRMVDLTKTRHTTPRKTLDDGETEQQSVAAISDSMRVDDDLSGARVLVLDDTIGDGGTLKEVGRALRVARAAQVYGLVVTKNARGMRGGIDQSKEQWS